VNEEAEPAFETGPLPASRGLAPYAVRVNASIVKRGFWPKLRRVAGQIPFAEDAAALWYCAIDRETPVATKAMLLAALAFFVIPKPFRPKRAPLPGLVLADDAAVIAAAIALANRAVQPRHREMARRMMHNLVNG